MLKRADGGEMDKQADVLAKLSPNKPKSKDSARQTFQTLSVLGDNGVLSLMLGFALFMVNYLRKNFDKPNNLKQADAHCVRAVVEGRYVLRR